MDEKLWGEDEERPHDPAAKTERDAPVQVGGRPARPAAPAATCPAPAALSKQRNDELLDVG